MTDWKIITILNALKDAGLPEPEIDAGLTWEADRAAITLDWDNDDFFIHQFGGIGENAWNYDSDFKTLPEAIDRLKQLLNMGK